MSKYKIVSGSDEPVLMTDAEVAELAQLTKELAKSRYKTERAVAYPDFREYLDGVVKGDQAQIQAYIDACLAVKAKYPKPE
jgi:hypothetical protein